MKTPSKHDTPILAAEILQRLRSMANPKDLEGQRRFGISSKAEQLGIRTPVLKAMAKEHRRNHDLAQALWDSGVHEARMLAILVEDPKQVSPEQMERWIVDCDNWALTDACCFVLFDRTPTTLDKVVEWSSRPEEFVKRASFAIMAGMAIHRKELSNDCFLAFLPIIEREAMDNRNFVKKAVNWALRQIGKRNAVLHAAAVDCAERIAKQPFSSARWIAKDALREFQKLPESVRRRINSSST